MECGLEFYNGQNNDINERSDVIGVRFSQFLYRMQEERYQMERKRRLKHSTVSSRLAGSVPVSESESGSENKNDYTAFKRVHAVTSYLLPRIEYQTRRVFGLEYRTRSVREPVERDGPMERRYVKEKKWYCGCCNFGPLDWTYDTHCVDCGHDRRPHRFMYLSGERGEKCVFV